MHVLRPYLMVLSRGTTYNEPQDYCAFGDGITRNLEQIFVSRNWRCSSPRDHQRSLEVGLIVLEAPGEHMVFSMNTMNSASEYHTQSLSLAQVYTSQLPSRPRCSISICAPEEHHDSDTTILTSCLKLKVRSLRAILNALVPFFCDRVRAVLGGAPS